ncbi:hypothetical protein OG594_22880 [Streptomyces sp. NBC_01214]|uniref:hypothetical protein n=1 Tax=Streptomyces sp. NBC_01214 TaxID=2903777 RepID=UPI00224F519B|nr:hypothetical protein [Streptomyces sp. NBC_01214]MCX4804447.1 hypothetical protein [Streptomyces sp. NBC_01214]
MTVVPAAVQVLASREAAHWSSWAERLAYAPQALAFARPSDSRRTLLRLPPTARARAA